MYLAKIRTNDRYSKTGVTVEDVSPITIEEAENMLPASYFIEDKDNPDSYYGVKYPQYNNGVWELIIFASDIKEAKETVREAIEYRLS